MGIVTHSDCVIAVYSPEATTLFTSTKGMIKPVISKNANIAKLLNFREDI